MFRSARPHATWVALVTLLALGCGPNEEERRTAEWRRVASHFEPRIEALREADAQMRVASDAIESADGDTGQIMQGTARARFVCATNHEAVAALADRPSGELSDPMVSSSVLLVTSAAQSFVSEMGLYCAPDYSGQVRNLMRCEQSCITSWMALQESIDGMADAAALADVTIPRLTEP